MALHGRRREERVAGAVGRCTCTARDAGARGGGGGGGGSVGAPAARVASAARRARRQRGRTCALFGALGALCATGGGGGPGAAPAGGVGAMRLYRPWTTKHWCDSVVEPQWPLSYSKHAQQNLELKGRVNSNIQDMRHKCAPAGTQSKCHICEDIKCGDYVKLAAPALTQKTGWEPAKTRALKGLVSESALSHNCSYQIQGVQWKELSKNVPAVTDTPWAVGGAHRNDFGAAAATHACVMLSGAQCISPYTDDFSKCKVRCWGFGQKVTAPMKVRDHTGKLDATKLPRNNPHMLHGAEPWPTAGDYGASDSWERKKSVGNAQGEVSTLSGSGVAGHRDGPPGTAKFNGPQGVAVDRERYVYVADTKNHCIRRIDKFGATTTFAGSPGKVGHQDGRADKATFSSPTDVAVYYDWRHSFSYKGCIRHLGPSRALPVPIASHAKMNPTMCWRLCWNYAWFAVQRGTECHCGASEPAAALFAPDEECHTACGSYAGTPEDPPWGSRSWGPGAAPPASKYTTIPDGPTQLRTDRGKCGGMQRASLYRNRNHAGELYLFVADTGNHRIRVIKPGTAGYEVLCFAGRCGNGTFSASLSKFSATPQPGFADGTGDVARLHTPMGVAVDNNGTVFVADTGNRLVRFINYEGVVHTLAGKLELAEKALDGVSKAPGCPPPCLRGVAGTRDGPLDTAEFMHPSGVAVGLNNTLVVTDNHRVRSVTYSRQAMIAQYGDIHLNKMFDPLRCAACATAFASANVINVNVDLTLPNSALQTSAPLKAGDRLQVGECDEGKAIMVVSAASATQITVVAGHTCTSFGAAPARVLSFVAEPKQSGLGTLLSTPGQWPGTTTVRGIESRDRVVTLAGHDVAGRTDGEGGRFHDNRFAVDEKAGWASFSRPEGVAMDLDGRIYVSGTGSCRIRRITSAAHTAHVARCDEPASEMWRPSGCSSYNPPTDQLDFTATPGRGNIYLRYDERAKKGTLSEYDIYGRRVYNCQGTPPPDRLVKGPLVIDMQDKSIYEKSAFPENYQLVFTPATGITEIKEDTGDGSTIKVMCPAGCAPAGANVHGNWAYTDSSSVCLAARHADAIGPEGGLVTVTMRRGLLSRNGTHREAQLRNGVQSVAVAAEVDRVFTIENYPQSTVEVQTIAGHPTTIMAGDKDGCGFLDTKPPQEARFNRPAGLAVFTNTTMRKDEFLIVADANNHRIRRVTAVCSQICENGGFCAGADRCQCAAGWEGYDCTRPVCAAPCPARQLCVAPGTCDCAPGYSVKPACTTPLCAQTCQHGGFCSAPDTCTCAPGWFDANCTTPVCTQTCGNGGNCTAPNICTCPTDWTGVDCRVPVCEQAQWNGHDGKLLLQLPGVNTPPGTRREGAHPIYRCRNGGYCSAPNTCICPPQWSGHDCGLPVCSQGFFRPDGEGHNSPPAPPAVLGASGEPFYTRHQPKNSATFTIVARPSKWKQYVPCHLKKWVAATDTFDFAQRDRATTPLRVLGGAVGSWRTTNGHNETQPLCLLLEMGDDAVTQFQYLQEDNKTTPYAIYTPKTPFGPGATGHQWRVPATNEFGRAAPWTHQRDRQVALAELHDVRQGAYVCANGGNCSSPDVCSCAKGWIGFDCRTPVCEQGFYEPDQREMTMPDIFSHDRGKADTLPHPAQPDSNPAYAMEDVNISYADVHAVNRTYGDIRYLQEGLGQVMGIHQKWSGQSGMLEVMQRLNLSKYAAGENPAHQCQDPKARCMYQGGYSCSIRSLTHWERPGTLGPSFREGTCHASNTSCAQRALEYEHPNYISGYMDKRKQADDLFYTHWEGMQWDPIYEKCARTQAENTIFFIANGFTGGAQPRDVSECLPPLLDETNEGHRRDGVWRLTKLSNWRKGVCVMQFNRTCKQQPAKAFDLVTRNANQMVYDTDASFRARLVYSYSGVKAVGGADLRWRQQGGECVDEVIRGCYNNGTCVAPNTCRCAPGWTGFDCSVPICAQECQHNGNCTLPNRCTCERGWTGAACETAMCAQDCNNGGKCIAPDVCECRTWPTSFKDSRDGGGRPLFRQPSGDPMYTGWTGYDCMTPICVQAEAFLENVVLGHRSWKPLKGRAKWDVGCTNSRTCAQPQPLEPRTFSYVPLREPPAPITPGNCKEGGLSECVATCAVAHRCGPLCTEFDKKQIPRMCPVDCTLVMVNAHKACIVTCQQNCGAQFSYWDKTKYLGMLNRGLWESVPMPGKCYDRGRDYKSDWNTNVDPCPFAPYLPGTCAERDKCDEYDLTVVNNDGTAFQSGCALKGDLPNQGPWPRNNPVSTDSNHTMIGRLLNWNDTNNRDRTSNQFLCDVRKWEQGDYIDDGNSGMLQHGWHHMVPGHPGSKDRVRVSWAGQENATLWDVRGSLYSLVHGRHIRANHRNIDCGNDPAGKPNRCEGGDVWIEHAPPRAEGIYACYNDGACIYPDRCTCPDGWDGFDCQTPLCRHKQKDPVLGGNKIASCLNGGVCEFKDTCKCIQTESVLWKTQPSAPRGLTGYMSQSELPIVSKAVPPAGADNYADTDPRAWVRADAPLNPDVQRQYPDDPLSGRSTTDCSIAICVQGFYDPYCIGVAPGGQGCYRCNNGGNCTAPDHCTCAEGWTGYDCMTPVCTQIADKLTRKEIYTVDEARVHQFEMDPCGSKGGRWGMEKWNGQQGAGSGKILSVGQGNCTLPNTCTCLCKQRYDSERCRKYNTNCLRAWLDPLGRSIPWGFTFGGQKRAEAGYTSEGARDCYDGYEGNVNDQSQFTSCHLGASPLPSPPARLLQLPRTRWRRKRQRCLIAHPPLLLSHTTTV